MAGEVFYVRNTRPNAVLVRLGEKPHQTKFVVERRGSREDTMALPEDAKSDPVVASFIQRGIFEVITKDAFMSLGMRNEGRPAIPLVTRKAEGEVNIPMEPIEGPNASRTPTIITDENLTKSKDLRSPRPEFVNAPLSTEQEIATGIIQPQDPVRKNVPVSKEEAIEKQVENLSQTVQEQSAQIAQLLAALTAQTQPSPVSQAPWIPSPEELAAYRGPNDVVLELKKKTRNSLDSQARELGIKNPDKLQNKQQVIDAILAVL